ncbi:MAG: uroporphyrinogen-III C-methyltransferase [Gammaproteobacteria bacterium]|nr:uroporphyrinogen-III C-methyltransferase [Gammaproteobacteria bacterium]
MSEVKDVVVAKAPSPLWKIMSLVALAIAVISATMIIISAQNYQQILKQLSSQSENVQRLQASTQALSAQASQQQIALHNAVSGLDQLRLANAQDPVSPVLVEVDYLVRLANYNAQYVGDVKIVLTMLETAEQRISGLSSPQLADIRRALVSNITAIKGIKALDAEGVLLRLNALSDTINSLPVMPEVKISATANPANPVTDTQLNPAWKEKLLASFSELKKVIVVQHLNEPVQPLLSPEQHSNLVGNIQLKLGLAQWAVLHREPKVYSDALNQAKDWIGRFFTANEMTGAVITGLTELGKLDIKPTLPDLSDTVALVDHEIQNRHQEFSKSSHSGESSSENAPASSNAPKEKSSNSESSPGVPAPAAPLKAKPQDPTEPEVISS